MIELICKKTRSTCRKAVALLDERGIAHRYREYTEAPLSRTELKKVFKQLGVSPRALLRKNDKAYKEKDKVSLARYLQHGDRIAPRNPKLRKLKEIIRTEETIVPRAFGAGVAVLLLVIILMQLGRWSSRRKVEKLAGGAPLGRRKKNKFIDDDDDDL